VLLILSVALGLVAASLFSLPQKPLLQASRYLTNRYGIVVSFLRTGEEQFHEVRESSLRERIDVFRAGLQMFTAHPLLGVGPGNFPLVIGDYDPNYSAVYSHNTYLSVLAELGIVGYLFFILLCLRMLVSIYRISRSSGSGGRSFYTYLLLSCLALFFIFLFLHDLDSKYLWTLFLPVALFADSGAYSTSSAGSA
jgi:O-antigen ligase